MCENAPHISVGSKISDTCRKKLSKQSPVRIPTVLIPDPPTTEPYLYISDPDSPSLETEESAVYVQTPAAIFSLNNIMCLAEIGKTS